MIAALAYHKSLKRLFARSRPVDWVRCGGMKSTRLIVADSDHDANLLYATGLRTRPLYLLRDAWQNLRGDE